MKTHIQRTRSKGLKNITTDRQDKGVRVELSSADSRYGPIAGFYRHGNKLCVPSKLSD
jgi:hypothetical protein